MLIFKNIFRLLYFAFVLLCVPAQGQNTKLVVKKVGKPKQVSERYHVLRSNKKTKHGACEIYFRLTQAQLKAIKKGQDSLARFVMIRGAYAYNKKQGAWIEYSKPGIVYSEGHYDKDKKIGIWRTSKADGEVMEHYDFDTRRRLEPEIRIPISYPPTARENGVQGTVIVQYQSNADCSITNVKVIQSVNAACDAEAVRCLGKYFRYLREYGPPPECVVKTDTFQVVFRLE